MWVLGRQGYKLNETQREPEKVEVKARRKLKDKSISIKY